MKKTLLALSCIVVLLLSCDFHPDDTNNMTNEEHAIISAVLDSIRYQYSPTNVDVYDLSSTNTNCSSLNIAFEIDSIETDTLLNIYYDANRLQYYLNRDKLPDYITLKDRDESNPYTGYLSFTRPGISEDGLIAVVEYSCMGAPLAGAGYAVLLEKHSGQWQMIWHKMMWIF